MAIFHLVHWIPEERLHVLNGYQEVIETLLWGLSALGHEATSAVNAGRADARLIVLGAQMMPLDMLRRLPEGSIVYNLEQLSGLAGAGRDLGGLAEATRRCVLWDYSELNLLVWRSLGRQALLVPIGFAPPLARIAPASVQDIDVLMYGTPSHSRLQALHDLCGLGITTMFFYGLYGAARDALLARAKLVLSVTINADSAIFPIVRASYLFANRKAVLSDLAAVERDVAPGVGFAPQQHLAGMCRHFLAHETERRALEEEGHRIIRRRDIRSILHAALRGAELGSLEVAAE
jgi:hypothetical protein